jgi:Spy/CpxP family protein refolding chaperone
VQANPPKEKKMETTKTSKWIIGALVIMMVGLSATAFAGRRGGYGPGACWGVDGADANLTDEQITKLQEEQKAFYEATAALRQNEHQKRLELASEMAKEKPDRQKAVELQKAISELRTQLDQKRLEHAFKVKQINPNAGPGLGWGMDGKHPMMGRGMGGGPMMGRGMGAGPCWNN